MAVIRWGFESGVNNDTLNATNANADYAVTTGGTAVISTAQAFEGTRSALITGTTTSGGAYFQKTVTATNQIGVDTLVYVTSFGSSEAGAIWIGNGSSRQIQLAIVNDGRIRIRDGGGAGGANAWTSTATLSLNTWYRLSLYAVMGDTTGSVRAAFYSGSSSTPIEDSGLLTNSNTGALQYDTFRIGTKVSTGTVTLTAHFDNYGYDTSANGLIAYGGNSPVATASASPLVRIVDASSSTGTSLTYSISQTAGPTKIATLIATGKWSIPVDAEQDTTWNVTVTQPDTQSNTTSITIAYAATENPPVELLYATGPGTFV